MIIEALVVGGAAFAYLKGYRIKRAARDRITGRPAPILNSTFVR